MRPYVVLIALTLLLTMQMAWIAEGSGDGGPDIWTGPDLRVEINIPENGERYQKELGLRVNVTVFNDGEPMSQLGANLTMTIRTLEDDIIVHSTLPRPFNGLGADENITFTYDNWTGIAVGRFICNVTVAYPDDVNMSNNYMEHTFSVWSDYFPFPPKFETGSVSKLKGNIDTLFEYKVEYKYNKYPDAIKVEIDGVNHTMEEEDPLDDIPDDGKSYIYSTRLSIGNHRHRFFGEISGKPLFASPVNMSQYHLGPWVNVTLNEGRVSPTIGFVTTDFLFTVNYGSDENLPPNRIYIDVNDVEYNMSRSSPTPNYQSGNVEFKTRVLGMDMIPSPIEYSFHVETGSDVYSIGPYKADGPRMKVITLRGNISDLKGTPLGGVQVSLDPGGSTVTELDGTYSIQSYVGRDFDISYSKEGFISRSYEIDLLTDWNIDAELEPLPVGGIVQGTVFSNIDGVISPLEGALVNLSGVDFTSEVMTDVLGQFVFNAVPASSDYDLTVSESRHRTKVLVLDIDDSAVVARNITLMEKDLAISITPDPMDDAVSIDQVFELSFSSPPDISTVSAHFKNTTASIPAVLDGSQNSTSIEIWPSRALDFDQEYEMVLAKGILNLTGSILLWRNLTWNLRTQMQPMGETTIYPIPDSEDVPLDVVISLSFGIGIDSTTFSCSIFNMDVITGALDFELDFVDSTNWSDSGRTDTVIHIEPSNLSYRTRYSVEISSSLTDIYGRSILTSTLEFGFITETETDTDNDGVPDSTDPFPEDPTEWSDRDNDLVGDNSDLFPDDPDESEDTDGDGIGDNGDEDDDGDQMPDSWEIENGLDPKDPDDAFLDSDKDGVSNLEEYLAGTDPQDKNSSPDKDDEGMSDLLIIIIAVLIVIMVVIIGTLFLIGRIGPGRRAASIDGDKNLFEE